MSRERCWECDRELNWVPGKGVTFKLYTDEVGNTHKLHHICYSQGGYADKALTAAAVGETDGSGSYFAPRSED